MNYLNQLDYLETSTVEFGAYVFQRGMKIMQKCVFLTVCFVILLSVLLITQRQVWQDDPDLHSFYRQNMLQMREVRNQLSIQLNEQTEKLFQLQCRMGNDVSYKRHKKDLCHNWANYGLLSSLTYILTIRSIRKLHTFQKSQQVAFSFIYFST